MNNERGERFTGPGLEPACLAGCSAGRGSVRFAEDPSSSPGQVNFSLLSLFIKKK